jgi:hypothetical protein
VRFGVYEIDCHADGNLYELGRGAMGVTYRATDASLQRKVALRSLRSTSLSEALTRANALCTKPVQPQHCDTNTSPPSTNSECALKQDNIFTRWNSSSGATLEARVHRAGLLHFRATIDQSTDTRSREVFDLTNFVLAI